MKAVRSILRRLPSAQSIWGVYAVIVTLVYSWTLFTSFYQLPSWMFYLTVGQILSVYAYSFVLDLVESVLVLGAVLFLDQTLFFALGNKEGFQARSIAAVLAVLILTTTRLTLFQTYEDMEGFLSGELTWWVITLCVGMLVAVFISRIALVRNVLGSLAERATVFLYIYLPLSFISLIIIMLRNVSWATI